MYSRSIAFNDRLLYMGTPTLLREAEHAALRRISLSGHVIDLGGDARSDYRKVLGECLEYTSVNLDPLTKPDLVHDLELPLPLADNSYDHALLINVLEHVYGYQQLLGEAARVIRPGGTVVMVVPFLFPVHPSPDDFWRFTRSALERLLHEVGLETISAEALGTGVFAARYLQLDRLLPLPIRFIAFYTRRPIARAFDAIFSHMAAKGNKKYVSSDYPLGYCIQARKAV